MHLESHWTSHCLPIPFVLSLLVVIFHLLEISFKVLLILRSHFSRRKYIFCQNDRIGYFCRSASTRWQDTRSNSQQAGVCVCVRERERQRETETKRPWFVQSLGIKWHFGGGLSIIPFVMKLKPMLAYLMTALSNYDLGIRISFKN